MLSIFQLFYHNGRLPLTNGLLVVPNGSVPKGEEKINLKSLDEMFRDTHSHGLVDSIQFLGILGILFGVGITALKDAITELYKNLSNSTLSGANEFCFEYFSDLTSAVSFKIK